jgi:transcriptional regulator with XRE-family HTH domain
MAKNTPHFSRQTLEAIEHFGTLLSVARKNKHLSVEELTDRLDSSRSTVLRVLKGSPTVNIGVYFEAARILGVHLFDQDPSRLQLTKRKTKDIEVLLPKRVRTKKQELNNDF